MVGSGWRALVCVQVAPISESVVQVVVLSLTMKHYNTLPLVRTLFAGVISITSHSGMLMCLRTL